MIGDNTYFGLENAQDIQKLRRLESELDERHSNDIENRLELGRLYRRVKDLLPHDGTWGAWLKDRAYSERESQRMMDVAITMEATEKFVADHPPLDFRQIVGNFRSWAAVRQWSEFDVETVETDAQVEHARMMLERIAAADRPVSARMIEEWRDEIAATLYPKESRQRAPTFVREPIKPADVSEDVVETSPGHFEMARTIDEVQDAAPPSVEVQAPPKATSKEPPRLVEVTIKLLPSQYAALQELADQERRKDFVPTGMQAANGYYEASVATRLVREGIDRANAPASKRGAA